MVVYFLYSTSVFPFYIDVVLALSIVSTNVLVLYLCRYCISPKAKNYWGEGGIHSLWQYIESWSFWGGWPCWTLWRDVLQVDKLQMFWKHEHTQGAKSQQVPKGWHWRCWHGRQQGSWEHSTGPTGADWPQWWDGDGADGTWFNNCIPRAGAGIWGQGCGGPEHEPS